MQLFGADYFRRSGFTGMSIAIYLAFLPWAIARKRSERRRETAAHEVCMARHRERMLRQTL
jgi:hypothetical protein